VGATYQSFFLAPVRNGFFPPGPLFGAEVALHDFFGRGWLLGLDAAYGTSRAPLVIDGYGYGSFRFNELVLSASLVREWTFRYVAPSVGVRLSAVVMGRDFEDASLTDDWLATFSPGLVVGLRVRLPGRLALTTRGRVHYLLYSADGNRSLGYWELAEAVTYEF
jgi:hypothetical protein